MQNIIGIINKIFSLPLVVRIFSVVKKITKILDKIVDPFANVTIFFLWSYQGMEYSSVFANKAEFFDFVDEWIFLTLLFYVFFFVLLFCVVLLKILYAYLADKLIGKILVYVFFAFLIMILFFLVFFVSSDIVCWHKVIVLGIHPYL